MENPVFKRPRIPAEMYDASFFRATAFIGWALIMFWIPAILTGVVLTSAWPVILKILAALPLVWLAAHGLLLMGWVGHEGFHLSLAKNHFLSAFLGVFFTSMIPGYFEIGFAISHWNHHRFTNQASDPDCEHFGRYKNFWSRMLFSRITVNAKYFFYTLKMAFGRPLPFSYKFIFKPKTVQLLAWLNLLCAAAWYTFYFFLILQNPHFWIPGFVLPTVVGYLIYSLQPYLEHSGTEVGAFKDTRSRISRLMTVLYFGNNYHLEHHLYPGVPCYKLPALHRLVKSQGIYEAAHSPIESSYIGVYRFATAISQYPLADTKDSSFDPMQHASQ